MKKLLLLSLFIAITISGCGLKRDRVVEPPRAELTPRQLEIVERLDLDADLIAQLEAKPLYEFTEQEVGAWLPFIAEDEPDLPARVVRIGRKNINQPYELHLLGEFPIETYDPLPLYCLDRSDCVVFSEHTYAMALTRDWPSFFTMLQRIRYNEGRIGVATRNHYTEADWTVNNDWLARDITEELGAERLASYDQTVDRARFLEGRYNIVRDIPRESLTVTYIPNEEIEAISPRLRDGDMVHVVVGNSPADAWVTHVGLVAIADDGTVNFLHSTPPRVREEPLATYVERGVNRIEERKEAGRSYLLGFKFLRLNDDPVANLRRIDGPDAPRISITESQQWVTLDP